MFQTIRHRLLMSYLAVLTVILTVAVLGIRVTFIRILNHQLQNRLETLAKGAALELELEGGDVTVDNEPLVNANQAIQWFDYEGRLLDDQGDYVMVQPLDPEQAVQTQTAPYPATSLTVPVNDYGKGIFIGYVRVSESTKTLQGTVRSLDVGMAISMGVALTLSGVGGFWLTRQAMEPIERNFRLLQRFTSDAAHELRSPLAAVSANAAVALKYSDGIRDADAQKFRAIKSASTQLTALTENLLTLARTDQPVEHQPQSVDLSEMFELLTQLYQPRFTEQGLELHTQIAPDLQVTGDQMQLHRLFTNLIDNALRYTLAGGQVAMVAQPKPSRKKVENDGVVVIVTDTGIGMTPDQLEHIFERFWQADQARSYQAGGFGLGLAIAQAIAHNHGGEITVTSEPGKGSCFTIDLPVISPQNTPENHKSPLKIFPSS